MYNKGNNTNAITIVTTILYYRMYNIKYSHRSTSKIMRERERNIFFLNKEGYNIKMRYNIFVNIIIYSSNNNNDICIIILCVITK